MKRHAQGKRQANRQYKNNLFVYLFTRKKKYALSLYNAMNGTDYTNEEDLEFKVLEDVLFVRMKNDVSFVFDSAMNLYEHQSTFSNNMPLRGLYYFADLYRKLIPTTVLNQKKLVRIPVPKYIVFYNGPIEDMPEGRRELRLSDAFLVTDETGGFEWTATVVNINPGYNEELFVKCEILREYAVFVEKVRKKSVVMSPDEAMREAIMECIEEGILLEFFRKYGEEIIAMEWYEVTQEMIWEIQREEAIEDAREEGMQQGMQQGIEQGIRQGKMEAEKAYAKERAEDKKIIFLLRQEIENLRRQLSS
ncbi:MAG: hypothetical protein IJ397_00365 [Lachnospiraceae bacterium]|nr:hypothetical protein [Lachnospiraceae bacterium]